MFEVIIGDNTEENVTKISAKRPIYLKAFKLFFSPSDSQLSK